MLQSKAKRIYRGTKMVAAALGARRQDFQEWVTEQRAKIKALLDEVEKEEQKKGANLSHIKESVAKRFAELLPVVKCADGKRRYVLTGEQLVRLDQAMHPPREVIEVNGEELSMIKDELPQPRVNGRKSTWTAEMLAGDFEHYLPPGWAEEVERRGVWRMR